MKIELNIGKKHLYILTVLIVIVFGGISVIAGMNSNARIFHKELAVDKITGYQSDTTTIDNNLVVTGTFNLKTDCYIAPGSICNNGNPTPDTVTCQTGYTKRTEIDAMAGTGVNWCRTTIALCCK